MPQYPAIALIEFDSIAIGVHTGDAMLKKALIDMVKAGTVHRGKYLVLIGGTVGAVEESYGEGLRVGGPAVVDSVVLPEIHPAAHDAILGARVTQEQDALGVIETSTVAAAVHAADAGIKAANVIIPEVRLADGLGGKGITLFAGLVADVEAAVAAGAAVVEPHGVELRQIVIPAFQSDMRRRTLASSRFYPPTPPETPEE